MQIRKRKSVIYVIVAFLAGGLLGAGAMSLAGGGLTGSVRVPADEYRAMNEVYERYELMEQLYEAVDTGFYQEVDQEKLMQGAYKGYIDALEDPYSAYMTEEEYSNWKTGLQGEYSGIGITFSQDKDGNYVVVSVEKESPAADAGIEAGDILLKADGKAYDNMDLLADAIKGKEGTQVSVTYSRNDEENTVTMTRRKIVQHSVSYEMVDDDTGYIAITSFLENTADEFNDALKAVEKKGAANLVLDLRDNGGGLLTSCIDVADEFLDKGVVVSVEGKNQQQMEYEAEDGKTGLETVVLVNENSASAAEILAAALKDNGFSIVGTTTFGKGVIQSTTELEDGSALKLTIMEYFSPKGNAIHKKGVTPTDEVANEENSTVDMQMEKALDLLK